MKHQKLQLNRRRQQLRLMPLENRLAPSANMALISRTDPSLFSDTAGGYANPDFGAQNGVVASSTDGRYTVFSSQAANVVPGQIDNNGGGTDVFVFDRAMNATELISHIPGSSSTTSNGSCILPTISGDGRYVAFTSSATDLIPGGTIIPPNGHDNIFVYDRQMAKCTVVSRQFDLPNTGANVYLESDNLVLKISANGQTITFNSKATNLVPGMPTPPTLLNHAYAYEIATGSLHLVDHKYGDPSAVGNGGATVYDVSDDGRYIAFTSNATDLTGQPVGSKSSVYRYDLVTGQNLQVTTSAVAGQTGPSQSCGEPQISGDGDAIVFYTSATNMISGYSGMGAQYYKFVISTGQRTLITHAATSPTTGANKSSDSPIVSVDGRYVAFASLATDLVSGFIDNNGAKYNVFLADTLTGDTSLVSHSLSSSTKSANDEAGYFAMSADGQRIVFCNVGNDLVAGYSPQGLNWLGGNSYLYETPTGAISLVSGKYGSPTVGNNHYSGYQVISADGSTIIMTTKANDIMSGLLDLNNADDVYVRDVATGVTICATRGSPSFSPGGDSGSYGTNTTYPAQVSADGRYTTYVSVAGNIVAGQVDGVDTADVFIFDRQTSVSKLVSHKYNGKTTTGNGQSSMPVISADGRYVAYTSYATDLVFGFTDGNGNGVPGSAQYSGVDLYLYDRVTESNTLISHVAGSATAGGNQTSGSFADNSEYRIGISADGRYVTYFSLANNLVAGFVDKNGTTPTNNTGSDVYVFDRTTGQNTLVSRPTGLPLEGSNDSSYAPTISADGRFITYWSYGHNLVPGMNAVQRRNVFLFDQQTGETTLVSHADGTTTLGGNGWSTTPGISADGNYIVYSSKATNIIAGQLDTNNQYDVFLYNRLTDESTLVTRKHDSPTTTGDALSDNAGPRIDRLISADGRFVAFHSHSSDLVAGFVDGNLTGNQDADVYLYDRQTNAVTLLSHNTASATTSGNKWSFVNSISGDGRFVTYHSSANNLTPMTGIINGNANLFMHDRLLDTTTLVSHGMSGPNASGDNSSQHAVSNADGSVIAFLSSAGNLVASDYNSKQDVFAYVTPPPRVSSLQINDGSVQRSIVKSITMSFDEPIFISDPAAAFTLTRIGSSGSVQLSSVSQNSPNGSVTLTFSGALTQFGSLIDGNYSLSINAAMVSNIAALDGNGDGVAGDNWVSPAGSIFRLFGDMDGDRAVAANDFIALRLAFGGSGVTFDFDNNGYVGASDFIQFKLRFGGSI